MKNDNIIINNINFVNDINIVNNINVVNIEETISQMTLEEKASLCSGLGYWDTKPIARLRIKSFIMTDGPNGVRMQQGDNDRFGLNESAKATCFPTGSCLACSWDQDLMEKIGGAIGREARAKNVSLVLGPAINMKRSPLCGRNFEYLSEDPLLAGKLGAAYVNGMQAEGVGATPKHFAANNQEQFRQTIDTRVDERTLREIYLKAFEIVVEESAPWMLMSSYNQINGEYASQNKKLLKDILRDEWGYEGLVVTDWYGNNERPKGVAAGQDLEMPGSEGICDAEIVQAVLDGVLDEKDVDTAVRHFLNLYNTIQESKEETSFSFEEDHTIASIAAASLNFEENHAIASMAAAEGSVLLKNDNDILPLSIDTKIAVIGAFAKSPRYQGGGSSHLNANQMDYPWDCLSEAVGESNLSYSAGYDVTKDEPEEELIADAVKNAAGADAAVIFCGLTDNFESEGFDRETMLMPESHNALIEAVAAVNKHTIVVLQNGSAIEMPWADKVEAILESYLGGEAAGSAAVKILLGEINPSGKLAESFPMYLKDNPSYLNFPGCREYVEYREGVFIGYRYYASADVRTRFSFGHGLSYTTFAITDMKLSADKYVLGDEDVIVSCRVKNTGARKGKETVQIYVHAPGIEIVRPKIELKGFAKVELEAGEEKEVRIPLADLRFWKQETNGWELEGGNYQILIGNSSENLLLSKSIEVEGSVKRRTFDHNTLLGDLLEHPKAGAWAKETRQQFTISMTGGIENTHTKLLLEKSTVEQPLRVLLCTGFLTKETLRQLLLVLNEENTDGEDLSWLLK